MAKRKNIGKKVRFEVFKRDSFTCQYCGRTPPKAVLEVDHIIPVADGGKNDSDNLVSACIDCNRGKGARSLSSVPQSLTEKHELLEEKEAQIEEYGKLLKKKRRRENKLIEEIEAIFSDEFECMFHESERESIRQNFLPVLTPDDLMKAISRACGKCSNADSAFKYFCGICWCLIRGNWK